MRTPADMSNAKVNGFKRFTEQRGVKIRTAEGRSAHPDVQRKAASALKVRYSSYVNRRAS